MTLRAPVIEMGVSNGAAVCTDDLCEPIQRAAPPPPPHPSSSLLTSLAVSLPLLLSLSLSLAARLFCQLSFFASFPRPIARGGEKKMRRKLEGGSRTVT